MIIFSIIKCNYINILFDLDINLKLKYFMYDKISILH